MKKLTALFLTLILLVSLTVPAFAARDVSFETELAGELKQLGLFKGVSDTDFALGRAPTRLEALMMLIRALGKESEAAAGSWTHPFTDVNAWWSPYVGYAYETGLTTGVRNTGDNPIFGLGDADARMYLTFMLRALGYSDGAGKDFLWNDPYALAKEVGILPDRVNTEEFWRADVVSVTYAALNACMKGSEQTLAEKLIAADVFTEAQFNAVYREDAFSTALSAAERTALSAEEIYALCMPAVFYIEVYDDWGDAIASGSGFFIDNYGTAVTNHHVIYGASSAKVTLSDSSGKEQETLDVLGVYAWSEEEDWAVLKVDCSGNSYLRIGDAASAVGGAQVYALGSPLGLSASISDGMISNPARQLDGQTYIQISAPISHGSSGGALVNKFGEVIGITAAGFDAGQNLNLAVPIDRIAGSARGELTPISGTYVMASGIVYPETRYVTLQPGESVTNVITALKYDTEERLTVEYEIEDRSIVSCSWDGWSESDTEVTLHLTAGDTFGSTYVYIYLYTADSEELLDYDYIYVEVAGGTIATDKDYVELELTGDPNDPNGYGIVWVDTHCFDSRSYSLRYTGYDESLINCQWGTWETTSDGHRIPLYLAANASGSTEIQLEMFDYETKEVLASTSVYVTVIGGYLSISSYYVSLLPGESATVTISGEAADPGTVAYIATDEYPSEVIDWDRGALSGNPATLTITAKDIGSDYIIITLLDENGAVLCSDYIDVDVNSGRITADTDYLEMMLGESATVQLSAAVVGDRDVTVRLSDYNDYDTVDAVLGDLAADLTIPLTITAKKCGSAYVSVNLFDAETEEYIASCSVYAVVSGGTLSFSEETIMLAPGETKTVTISGTALDGSQNAYLTADEFPSNYIDWNRGRLEGNPATLTITAKAEGSDLIIITLYNDAGEELVSDSIWVYVNMDGRGDDETGSEPEAALPAASELKLENGAMELAIGERVAADLDGDGVAETVRLWLSGDENGYPVVRLSIDGEDYTDALYALVEYFDQPDDSFWAITDVDAADGKLEIAVQDWGPSDDPVTRFFRFDGSALTDLGSVDGFLFFTQGAGTVKVSGGGIVRGAMRLRVLQNWSAMVDYAVGADGKFTPKAQDYYESTREKQMVTLLSDLYCYDAPNGTRSVLPADTAVQLVGTDNVSWLKVLRSDGSAAWLHLDGNGYQLESPNGPVAGLSGLDMAG